MPSLSRKSDAASIYSTSSTKPLVGSSSTSPSPLNQKSTSSKLKSFFSGLGEPPTAAYDREQALKNGGQDSKLKQEAAILGYGAGMGIGLERK
ncbi:hypothetical protein B7463_g1962, partial [Scytalidium lignicola]